MDWGRIGKGAGVGMPDETAKALGIRYDRAYIKCGHRKLQVAVRDYAVFDKPVPSSHELSVLICGLNNLVEYFGIDPGLQITHGPK
jgi:hypothetical protein